MWRSIITTGDIRLLPYYQRSRLSKLYFEIENHNYEAKRVRDSAIYAKLGIRSMGAYDGMTQSEVYWRRLSDMLIEREKELKQKINDFLEKYWVVTLKWSTH